MYLNVEVPSAWPPEEVVSEVIKGEVDPDGAVSGAISEALVVNQVEADDLVLVAECFAALKRRLSQAISERRSQAKGFGEVALR